MTKINNKLPKKGISKIQGNHATSKEQTKQKIAERKG